MCGLCLLYGDVRPHRFVNRRTKAVVWYIIAAVDQDQPIRLLRPGKQKCSIYVWRLAAKQWTEFAAVCASNCFLRPTSVYCMCAVFSIYLPYVFICNIVY
jgi:hypothetical protein